MKHIKRTLAVLLAIVMTLSMTVAAFAADGSLTITGAKAGEKYDLYKVFDLTYAADASGDSSKDAYSYTVTDAFKGYFEGLVDDKGNKLAEDPVAYVADLSGSAVGDLAKALVAYALEHNIPVSKTVTGVEGTTTVNNLEYGYYVMNPLGASGASTGNTTMFSLDTATPNATIKAKGEYPTSDKTIVETDDEGNETETDINNVSIGDDVTFKLTSKVPDMTGYTEYYFCFNDVLSKGLTYKAGQDISVQIVGVDEDGKEYTLDVAHAESIEPQADGTTKVFIQLTDILDFAEYQGDAVVVKYVATLNKDANIGSANDNKVKLEYSNDPKSHNEGTSTPGKPKDPTGTTTEEKTETFTTALKLIKTDQAGNILTGASFKIEGDGVNVVVVTKNVFTESAEGTYWKLKDGTYTTTDPATEGISQDKYESTTTKYKMETVTEVRGNGQTNTSVEAAVDANGTVTFAGLGEGTYTITETVVPDGYNAIEPIEVEITFDPVNKTFGSITDGVNLKADNTLELTIINQSGQELPSTGGIGTTIFYVIGSILVLGAAVLLVSKKRMNVAR